MAKTLVEAKLTTPMPARICLLGFIGGAWTAKFTLAIARESEAVSGW